MNLSDLRRLSVTSLLIAGLVFVWMILLAFQEADVLDWGPTRGALELFALLGWLMVGLGLFLAATFILGLIPFGVHQAPEGFARGAVRQVQCQNCKAVFFIHDSGHRPITHRCPNCKRLGIYDGTAPPVGKPPLPEPPARIIKLDLACQNCATKFQVTDTGARPMRIKCPHCAHVGKLQ